MKLTTNVLTAALLLTVIAVACTAPAPTNQAPAPVRSVSRQLCDLNIRSLDSMARMEYLEPDHVWTCGAMCAKWTYDLFASISYRPEVPRELYTNISLLAAKYADLNAEAMRTPDRNFNNDARFAATEMLIDVDRICGQVS